MSHVLGDSEDLPGEIDDILEADDEPQRPSFNDSDEFDASALLSQPFFDDSNGDLDVNEAEFTDIQASRELASASSSGDTNNSGSNMNQMQSKFQQGQQQQPRQQNNNFSSYDQDTVNSVANQQVNQMNMYSSGGGSPEPVESINRALSPEQSINLKVQEVQRKIQQVQQQIERVQLETSNVSVPMHQNALSSPQQQQQQQPQGVQNNFDMQAMMNQAAVATRSPPGRSVSMPIRRNQMQGSRLNQPTFMMQQPMQDLQRQQAMMGNSQSSSTHNGFNNNGNDMNNMQGFNQGGLSLEQEQQMLMMGNSVDGSGSSLMRNVHNFVQMPSLEQQQAMMSGSRDASVMSAMNNMQGTNIGVNGSMDGSMNSDMSSHMQQNMQQGFNMDNSVRSVPSNMANNMVMDPSMFMMQQQLLMQDQQGMENMSNMPNMIFGPDGQPIRQNSLPSTNSSNIAIMQGQSPNDLMGPNNFDLAQMQRAFQAQGLIPGPAGSMQGQMGQGGQAGQPAMSMEKLCESMRRSAMSRSLVKQLSGRSLSRTSSGRGLTKTHSGRSLSRQNSGGVRKQLSGRSLSGTNSGRPLQRSTSGRAAMMMAEGASAELPVRRATQDSKHRIQRDALSTSSLHTPRRGVFRHKSQSAVMGGSNPKTVVNIDGNSVGMF